MKNAITTVAWLAGAVTAFSQGAIWFQDYSGSGPNIMIFAQQTLANSPVLVAYGGYAVMEQQGNPSSATYPQQWPGGSTSYPANNPLTGTGYDVQFLAATGFNAVLSTLTPQGTISTAGFFTGENAGLFGQSSSDRFGTVPAGPATIALAVWRNNGALGAANTLATAQAYGYAWGISDVVNVTLFPGGFPVYFPSNLTSFSLGWFALAPPPQTTYTTNADNTLTLTDYGGPFGDVTVPTNVNGMTVTCIGDHAFNASLSQITSITMLDNIKSFGFSAFGEDHNENYSFGSVTIPGSVTNMGTGAFVECFGLTNVTICNGVTSIGNTAFFVCQGLTSLTIPGSVTNIEDYAFQLSDLASLFFQGNAPTADSSVHSDASMTAYYLPGTTGWSNFAQSTGILPVLWNPSIQAAGANFGVRSNKFGFTIAGAANLPIAVAACTNLACRVWTSLTNVTLTNGAFYFSDPKWTNYPGRFYGVVFP